MEVADQTLCADDLMLKRGFKGDKEVFEAAVSEDGKVMVVLDTRKDEKVLSQKLAREIVSRIQKLRKKSGLQVGETVEVRGAVLLAVVDHSDAAEQAAVELLGVLITFATITTLRFVMVWASSCVESSSLTWRSFTRQP